MTGPLSDRARVFFDGTFTSPRLDHPECVAVHSDGSVWAGGEAGQIYRIMDNEIEVIDSTEGFCLGLSFDKYHNLFICDLAHRAVFRRDANSGELELFAEGANDHRFVTPNFAVADADGGLYVSDSNVAGEPGIGILRFDADGRGEVWDAGPFDFANGLALSPDERSLYVVETWARKVTEITIDPAGTAAERRTVVQLPQVLPDGVTVGPDGMLYVACYEPSRILVCDPSSGAVATVADDPTAHLLCHPTNVAFRGSSLIAANLGRWHLTEIDIS